MSALACEPHDTMSALISPCGLYRYRLERRWGPEPSLPFCLLNPSTADAERDDPTIRRCVGFARREGAGGIVVVNKYAFRASTPSALWAAPDPFGPDNDRVLAEVSRAAAATGMPIVCGWGTLGNNSNRHIHILQQSGARLVCLGWTKGGAPRHPLYVRNDERLRDLFAELEAAAP
jgi:hypothetical protein